MDDKKPESTREITKLLELTVKQNSSDLHLVPYESPSLRIDGRVVKAEARPYTSAEIQELIYSMLSEEQISHLEKYKELDCAFSFDKVGRFRVNVARETNGYYATLRHIRDEIPEAREIGFPTDVWKDIVKLNNGLVLVTGITGSGKSTTLASLIQEISRTYPYKIICVEDPVEYLYKGGDPKNKSLIVQRAVGYDTDSFANAVKQSLRQDPDVILIGEIRDKETAQEALRASETGHLVLSTLHTSDAEGTIGRYLDFFESDLQSEVRGVLAQNLRYVLCQQLVPYARGVNRTLAMEILKNNSGIANMIRSGKTHQIASAIQTGRKDGMILMDDCLEILCTQKKISPELRDRYKSYRQKQ